MPQTVDSSHMARSAAQLLADVTGFMTLREGAVISRTGEFESTFFVKVLICDHNKAQYLAGQTAATCHRLRSAPTLCRMLKVPMRVSIRELKANPARAIALMQQGELVQITSHRRVVAELVPPGTRPAAGTPLSDEEAMQRLMASGLVVAPATKRFKLPTPVVFPPAPDGTTMSDLVIEMRGPR